MQRPTTISQRILSSLVFLLKAAQHLLFHGIINFAGVSQKMIVSRLGNQLKVFVKIFFKFELQLKIQRVPWRYLLGKG